MHKQEGLRWSHQTGKAIQASTQELRPRFRFQVRFPSGGCLTGLVTQILKICLHSQESFTSVFTLHLDYSCVLEAAQRWLFSSAEWAISAKSLFCQLLLWPQLSACPSLISPLTPKIKSHLKGCDYLIWSHSVPTFLDMTAHRKAEISPSHVHSPHCSRWSGCFRSLLLGAWWSDTGKVDDVRRWSSRGRGFPVLMHPRVSRGLTGVLSSCWV